MVSAKSRRLFFGMLTALVTCAMRASTSADEPNAGDHDYQRALKTLRAKLTEIKRGHFSYSGERSFTDFDRKGSVEVSGECYFDFPAARLRMDRTESEPAEDGETTQVTQRYLRIPGEEAVWISRNKRIDFSTDGSKLNRDFEPFDFRCFGLYFGSSFRKGRDFERKFETYSKMKPTKPATLNNNRLEYRVDFRNECTMHLVLDPAISYVPVENLVTDGFRETLEKSSVVWQKRSGVVLPVSFHTWSRSSDASSEVTEKITLRWENINQPVLDFSFDRLDLSHNQGDFVTEWTEGKPRTVGIVGTKFRAKP